MARPQLNAPEKVRQEENPFGQVQLMFSEDAGGWVYGGHVEIARKVIFTKIRLCEAVQRNDRSPDYMIDVAIRGRDGKAFWSSQGGAAWWKEENQRGEKTGPRIECQFNATDDGFPVNFALFPMDEQPKQKDWPEGYKEDYGPIKWRVVYTPKRAGSRPKSRAPMVATIDDEILF